MIGNVNWAEIAVLIAITLALTNWIKSLVKKDIGNYAMLISMAWAFVVVLLATMPNPVVWYEYVKTSIIVGLSACGLYDIRAGFTK